MKINYDLYTGHLSLKGKKKALFGLQYLSYFYVIYLFAIEVFTFLFILISNDNKRVKIVSTILVILSIVLIFLEPWEWFIH